MEKKYDIFISYRREGGLTTADIPESGKWFEKVAAQGSETAKIFGTIEQNVMYVSSQSLRNTFLLG